MKFKVTGCDAEVLAKRAMFLAWKACGGPFGMGFLQDRPSANEEDVYKNVSTAGDYCGGRRNEDGELYGDYVFGRMMKTTVQFKDGIVEVRPDAPRADYQGWARVYKSGSAIVEAAAKELNVTLEKA